jgi:hypothetical protein
MATPDEIRQLKEKYRRQLLGSKGVSGVGIEQTESGDPVLTVYLSDPSAQSDLPKSLEGHDVRYVVSGPFTKQS